MSGYDLYEYDMTVRIHFLVKTGRDSQAKQSSSPAQNQNPNVTTYTISPKPIFFKPKPPVPPDTLALPSRIVSHHIVRSEAFQNTRRIPVFQRSSVPGLTP